MDTNVTISSSLNLKSHHFWLHIAGWLAFMASPFILPLPFFLKDLPAGFFYSLIGIKLFSNLLLIGIFYVNLFYLTPRLLINRNKIRFGLSITILLAVLLLVNSILMWGISNDITAFFLELGQPNPIYNMLQKGSFRTTGGTIILFALIICASSLWSVATDRMKQQNFGSRLLFEKTSAELAMLRQQVSPHFLFNTLNNIRWLTRIKSERAEDYIIELSDILRYMLYEAGNNKVTVEDEITYLKKYMSLQRLRLPEPSRVDFDYEGNFNMVGIEPFLFIPFVENAFKYGVHPQINSSISICIMAAGRDLVFTCKNQIFDSDQAVEPDLITGIGIQNVRRRLEMYYPETHSLKITNHDLIFSVELRIYDVIHG